MKTEEMQIKKESKKFQFEITILVPGIVLEK